ncbi:hypothetical protein [Nocardioides caldifontis]|uniref:hypothetical protein n=1 Tax=Nocardioides caldifontis TaxID=2588938 RepID=UPI0011DFFAA8|nr:hypothetical protein [Nocardioides caldifontis]
MIITTTHTSRKAAIVMPTSSCVLLAADFGGYWGDVRPETRGGVSVMTAATDRDRTVILAADQLVPGTRAWSPPI